MSYAIDYIGGGAREVIGNVNGSFGSRYFLDVVNERAPFASCKSAFKSAWLVIVSNIWQPAVFPYTWVARKAAKLLNKSSSFKPAV